MLYYNKALDINELGKMSILWNMDKRVAATITGLT